MSLAENLLNSLGEPDYQNSRIAGIQPEEEHIIVGQDRTITVPNSLKTIAVKGDKDIETVTFDCVRYWDGHDLSSFAIYINYILANGDEGTYIPENITKLDDIFTFDWEIGSEITYAQGKLTFWIVAKLTDDNAELIKQWSSLQNSECSIAQGGDKIYVPEKQTDQDVISHVLSVSRESAESAKRYADEAKSAAEATPAYLDYLAHYNCRVQQLTANIGESNKLPNATGRGIAMLPLNVNTVVREDFEGGQYTDYGFIIMHPKASGEFSASAGYGYCGCVVVAKGIEHMNVGRGVNAIDLSLFTGNTPFPSLSVTDSTIGQVTVQKGRKTELQAMTNWSDCNIVEVETW